MKNNKIQYTPIEKLYIRLLGVVSFDSEELRAIYELRFKEAKREFKNEIISAYSVCDDCGTSEETEFYAEKYYHKTYGK